ncbi:hypothetical protein EJB05_18741 [Eragrostis curvula]|uniref:protein-serine/threonine phosphatase n=1 Tax=Eragrostis curvula TaxID=38414 RepID=A0A5J9VMX8_9POAL|nr:hypothetical protein EJB05_52643 [Eragrostis curvula]TVU36794.1 hypothetical protein EJB05_18741 [Eragrostis curvula]
MAEICCEEAKSTPAPATAAAAAAVTATATAAAAAVAVASSALERRRRRLEMRRFLEPQLAEDVRAGKRQRLARTMSGPSPVAGLDAERPPAQPDRMPRFGVTSVCGRRREMEDAVSIRPDFLPGATGKHHFFGVFDGHGCSHPDRPDELARIEAAGGRVIYWDGARVLGVLAMSRAIGDGYLKPYVSSEPEVTVTERTDEDECLILASDGLWDVVTNEMACEVVRACFRSNGPPSPAAAVPIDAVLPAGADADKESATVKGVSKAESDKACSDAAMLLAKLALARRSADNVSVVVVDLRRGL